MSLTGKYIVVFKHPRYRSYEYGLRIEAFEGKCDNFTSTGNCAFSNDKGEMLIVHYRDIVQMKPVPSEED